MTKGDSGWQHLTGRSVPLPKACPERSAVHGSSGARMPVATVFAGLEEGMTIKELVETYDGLTREHVEAVLEFAARSLETPAPAR